MKRTTAGDRFEREAREEACRQVGVPHKRVRVALPSDHKMTRTADEKGRRKMPEVPCEDLDRLAADGTRPVFEYIGADEPLAQPGRERAFYCATPGCGLAAVAQFVLDALETQHRAV